MRYVDLWSGLEASGAFYAILHLCGISVSCLRLLVLRDEFKIGQRELVKDDSDQKPKQVFSGKKRQGTIYDFF